MSMHRFLFSALLFPVLMAGGSAQAQDLIPNPTSLTVGEGIFALNAQTRVYTNLQGSDLKFVKSYLGQTLSLKDFSAKVGDGQGVLRLVCTGTAAEAAKAIDEASLQGYTLDVTPQAVTIEAVTPMGLFYGIQSVRQLLADGRQIPCVHIADQPRFTYRGLMLDCSRHFWPLDYLKRQVDALAYFKMDRLHLHLTDGGGWRLEIKKYPRLTTEAAYRTCSSWKDWWDTSSNRKYCHKGDEGAYGGYYTQKEMRELVRYAAERHITIIPEIEMPGHSDEVTAAYPELSCSGQPYTEGDFCVGNEQTFTFLENVLREVMRIFPSEYIHIGGDEATRSGWEKCPKCQKRMQDEHLTTTAELQSYLTARIERFLNANGRKLMGWDEILEGKLAPNATVMSWRGEEGGITAANMGHPVVMTPGAYCYLDQYQDSPLHSPKAMGTYRPLQQAYSYEPLSEKTASSALADHLLGVQGNLWTEYIETTQHADYMIYPRLMALAEVGWSHNKTSFDAFRSRVVTATRRMQAAGYTPFDVTKEYGSRQEARTSIDHEARGKHVIYRSPYSPSYTATGDSALTDGRRGDWGYGDGVWQGFIGKGLDVVVDMGVTTDIRDVSASFMQAASAWVYFPEEVTISVSDDGEHFDIINRQVFKTDTDKEYFINDCSWNGRARGRYVRYTATTSKDGGWIFTDEIVVNRK